MKDDENDTKSVDLGSLAWEKLDNIDTINETVNFNEVHVRKCTCKEKLKEKETYGAKHKEWQKLHFFGTYQELEDNGQDVIQHYGSILRKMVKLRLDL